MGTTESWVFLKDRQLILHTENDGPRVLRHGMEASDEPITLEELRQPPLCQFPRLYEEASRLLTQCEDCGNPVEGAEPRERDWDEPPLRCDECRFQAGEIGIATLIGPED
jgi:hypothetical protein